MNLLRVSKKLYCFPRCFSSQVLGDMRPTVKVAVIGGGAFGTAMATQAARCGHEVVIHMRNVSQANYMNEARYNPKTLNDFTLPANLTASNDLESTISGAKLVILSLPAQTLPGWLKANVHHIPPNVLLCNTAKGLYLKEQKLLSEAVREALGRDQPYAMLSGPSFAKEIMQNMPTAVVVGSKYMYHAVAVQRIMATDKFRVYADQDIIGIELGGSLKNPLAIGAGILEGMNMGYNTKAAYVTRSSLELMELCRAMGGQSHTISGLSGIGDLMLTAFGELSRNRSFGERIAKGEKIADITSHSTVEGIATAEVAVHFANKCGLDLPIFRTVASILRGDQSLENVDVALLGKEQDSMSVPHHQED